MTRTKSQKENTECRRKSLRKINRKKVNKFN